MCYKLTSLEPVVGGKNFKRCASNFTALFGLPYGLHSSNQISDLLELAYCYPDYEKLATYSQCYKSH